MFVVRQPQHEARGPQAEVHHPELVVRAVADGPRLGHIKENPSLHNCFAICSFHEKCVKSRTLSGLTRGGGHPLGYLAAWILEGASHPSKESHMRQCKPTHVQRLQARNLLRLEANYAFFRAKEVEAAAGDSEPEHVP